MLTTISYNTLLLLLLLMIGKTIEDKQEANSTS